MKNIVNACFKVYETKNESDKIVINREENTKC